MFACSYPPPLISLPLRSHYCISNVSPCFPFSPCLFLSSQQLSLCLKLSRVLDTHMLAGHSFGFDSPLTVSPFFSQTILTLLRPFVEFKHFKQMDRKMVKHPQSTHTPCVPKCQALVFVPSAKLKEFWYLDLMAVSQGSCILFSCCICPVADSQRLMRLVLLDRPEGPPFTLKGLLKQ